MLAGSGIANAATPTTQTLTVGFYDFPPAIYSDEHGQVQGVLVDITRRIIEHAGYTADFRGLPSARLYAALRDGSVDLWPGAPGKPELINDTLEGRETLSTISLNLYHRHDTPAPVLPGGLAKRGVIIINGYNYWPAVNQMLHDPTLGIRLHRAATHTSALQMLQHRRASFLLDYQAPVSQIMKQMDLPPLSYLAIHQVPIRFIVSRKLKDGQKVLDALDRAYAEMTAAGTDLSLPEE
jgi:polar amino acid transport system substrate-binding protein